MKSQLSRFLVVLSTLSPPRTGETVRLPSVITPSRTVPATSGSSLS